MSKKVTTKQKRTKKKTVKPTAKKKPIAKKKASKPTKKKAVKTVSKKKKTIVRKEGNGKLKELLAQQQAERFILTDQDKLFLAQHQTLKLQVELVPESCFFSNIRSVLKDSQWDKIRKGIYAKANFHCEICGGQGTKHPVECHEVWIYQDETFTQRLGHFQAICPLCHEVKHIGLAGVRGNGERARNRFIEVNELEKNIAEKILSAVWKQWRIRSKRQWKLEIDRLKEYDIDIATLVDSSNLKRQPKVETTPL